MQRQRALPETETTEQVVPPTRPQPRGPGRWGNAAAMEARRPRPRPGAQAPTTGTPTPAPTTETPSTTAPTTEAPATGTTAPTTEAPATGTAAPATEGTAAPAAGTSGPATELARVRNEVAEAAVSALPADVTGAEATLRATVEAAVRAAAGAAFDAAMDAERRARNPRGVPADHVDTTEIIAAGRGRYDRGPGIAVRRFGDYIAEARAQLRATRGPVTPAILNAALEIFNVRTGRSTRTYTNIQTNPSIELATGHPSGVADEANAAQNIRDVVEGRTMARSDYGNAPGGRTSANDTVLGAIAALSRPPHSFRFRLSEIAGASHSPNSRHYDGDAIDVDVINGQGVGSRHPNLRAFMDACRALGATLVLGPGDPGHSSHVHAQW